MKTLIVGNRGKLEKTEWVDLRGRWPCGKGQN